MTRKGVSFNSKLPFSPLFCSCFLLFQFKIQHSTFKISHRRLSGGRNLPAPDRPGERRIPLPPPASQSPLFLSAATLPGGEIYDLVRGAVDRDKTDFRQYPGNIHRLFHIRRTIVYTRQDVGMEICKVILYYVFCILN
jgi:hypothetical protein